MGETQDHVQKFETLQLHAGYAMSFRDHASSSLDILGKAGGKMLMGE